MKSFKVSYFKNITIYCTTDNNFLEIKANAEKYVVSSAVVVK